MNLRQRRVYSSSIPTIHSQDERNLHVHNDEKPQQKLITCHRLTEFDKKALICFTIISLITRLYRIHEPPAIVFDELHFAAFVENYLRREFAFDIHPWLGKLTLAGFAWLFGYRPQEGFEFIVGNKYHTMDYIPVRVVSAVFGSFCIPLMYLICRELDYSIEACIATTVLPLFDFLLLTESRLILLDSQLIFYLNLTLLCALRLWKQSRSNYGTKAYYRYLFYTAAAGAVAMSVKWTAGVTPFLVVLVCLFGIIFLKKPMPVHDCLLAAMVGTAVYLIPWYLHMSVARVSTPSSERVGDGIRHRLLGNETFVTDSNKAYPFLKAVAHMHVKQYVANKNVKTRHLWESRWYEWPLNLRGIMYYTEKSAEYSDDNPVFRVVYLLQNPATALWTTVAMLTFIPFGLFCYRYRKMMPVYWSGKTNDIMEKGLFLFLGYILNLLPYVLVERCYFLYHYMPALTFAQLMVGLFLTGMPKVVRILFTAIILITSVMAFVYWAPWVYCMFIHWDEFQKRQWMPRWN